MIRPRSFVAAALGAAVILSACGDGSAGPAATVNDIEISQRDVVDELEAIEANTGYVEAYESQAAQQGQPLMRGTEEGTFDTAFVSTVLSVRIQYALVESEVAERDLAIDDACRAAARDNVVQRLASFSADGDGEAVLDAFGDDYGGYLVDRDADFLALQADLAGQPCAPDAGTDPVEAYFEDHREEFAVETACVSHILVATEAEATEIAALLAGGAGFAQLAAERSTDPGSATRGGELGCAPAGQYVPEFDAAAFAQPVSQVGAPVETEFGFHLILVTERGVAELEDVRGQVEDALAQEVQRTFASWFDEALGDADVTVDRRYGTWDPTTASITRPAAAADAGETTTTTAG